ncbi:hypothetical protein Tco_0110467 [Tanacetum coccineum]
MTTTAAQQVALDNALVPLEKRVKIDKCNMRIDPAKTHKEPTYQVVLVALALTTCYPAFLIAVDVPEIYMHQFWFTINKKDSTSYKFNIVRKCFLLAWKYLERSSRFVLIFRIKNLMHFRQMKKLSPSLRNLAINEALNLSLKCLNSMGNVLQEECGLCRTSLGRHHIPNREQRPQEARKDKKAPAKVARSKGIELLSDATLLEEAQLKRALKRSKIETTIHQAGGSSEGVQIMGDSGDEDDDDQQGDDERTKSDDEPTETDNPKTSNDEEEIQDYEFVHTPEDYVSNDDESNEVTKEEYERINEELYGDVNVSLTDVEPTDKEKDDVEMIVVGYVNVNQEGVGNQVKDDAHATQKTNAHIPSFSISSDYAAKFLNFDSIPPTDIEVVSMMDINVQHDVPPPTISLILSSLYPVIQQIASILTPTITKATTSTTVVPDSETFHQRNTNLEKEVKELKDIDNSTKVISTIHSEVPKAVKEYLRSSLDDVMHKLIQKNVADIIKEYYVPEHARKQQVPKENIISSYTTALAEFDKKTTLFETMTKSKSFNKSPKQRSLFHALIELILEDEDAMNEGVAEKLKKRKPDDADKDKGPSAGLDQGLKRQKTSKDTKQSKKAKLTESSKGTSKSHPKSTSKSAQAEETVFEIGDTQGLHNLGKDIGNTDEQPVVNVDPKDWFKKLERPPTPDPEWNKGKTVENKLTRKWLSDLTEAKKTFKNIR